ncbi:MAG: hypothetical protein KKD18_04340 [Nanoarchaeota archaeon]|nr:hypothetical protein [Nanoarchaeota archaeon]MBU0977620.1 hypothetical protein [Nanoarchaeota archaeon]
MEFFKPTAAKLTPTVIIFLALASLPIIPAIYHYKCLGCDYTEYRSLWFTLREPSYNTFLPLTYVIIALEILIPYPLSCLIIRLSRKLKP